MFEYFKLFEFFSVDLNNKNRYINKMKNNNKEIRFWWVSDLVSDYELGNENEVNFVGKGELNEKMWNEIRKKVGLLKSFKLSGFDEDMKGEGWVMLCNEDWYMLVVDEGYDVRKCIKEYGDRMFNGIEV